MSNMNRIARSYLFVPADRPERFDKAAASGAHWVVLDLEDAVAPVAKDKARDAAVAWLRSGHPAIVRINGSDTAWHQDDMAMVQSCPDAALMLPKAEPASLRLATARMADRTVIALLETVRGFAALRELAAVPGLARIAFGSVDFALETGIADEAENLTAVRTQIVLESCLAGLAAPIDGVSVALDDADLVRAHALQSLQMGFGGKLCIHPRQVAAVNQAFQPNPAQVDWARRVLAAFAESGGAAIAVDGKMIDRPVVERARRLVAIADHE